MTAERKEVAGIQYLGSIPRKKPYEETEMLRMGVLLF
jgi:hypothetical protein